MSKDQQCFRCVTPSKCVSWGCCPGTWPAETTQKLPYKSPRTGRLVCYKCNSGYASDFDNLCARCRSPKGRWITATKARSDAVFAALDPVLAAKRGPAA